MAPARILPPDTIVERGPGGTLYARSPHPLGPYPARITERLDHWAAHAPDRTFLARRGADGAWVRITYADTLTRVRAIAQSLIDRGLSAARPVVILSGNSIEHGLLALGAMYAGVMYAPIAPAYSLLAREHATIKEVWRLLRPGLVFADDIPLFAPALASVPPGAELVACSGGDPLGATPFAALMERGATSAVDAAHAAVGPDTVAKILFTSGSTGAPKGVINTQRMLSANQEMLCAVLPFLAETPPVLCDWLPWNHTFGGNHNFGIALYNGGTLYIDDGRPTPEAFGTTIANLREIATTAYFNVPRGYDLLVPALTRDAALRDRFFSKVQMLFCAAAALRQEIADQLDEVARQATGSRIPLVTGLGATESAPFALCAGDASFTGGRIGVPAPGVELKLAPVGGKLEGRLRGPNVTPGYWGDCALTAAAFDEEGYYRLGDVLGFVDPADPSRGFVFEGRLSEDFKLGTGTWVRVGPLRTAFLARFGDLVFDVVITGHGREFVGALVFPNTTARGLKAPELVRVLSERLRELAGSSTGSAATIRRIIVAAEPPAIDRQELTDKGSVNQKAVLANRATLVDALYAGGSGDLVVDIMQKQGARGTTHPD